MKYLFIHKKIALYALTFLLIASCQKVITLDIDDSQKSFVLEGVLKNRDSASFFKVSKTVSIYDQIDSEPFSSASIMVQDENMVSYIFAEDPAEPGTYVNYNFIAEEYTSYSLSAIIEGQPVTANTFSKSKPIIDSLYPKPNQLDFNPPYSKWIFYHSKDPVNEVNFYRLRIHHNGKEPSQYYIGNDYYINGETYEAQFFGVDAFSGDTIEVEMLEMDPFVYDYIYGLSNALTTGPFSPAPSNPPSNLNADFEIQGYFGVYMTDTASIIVP